MIEANTMIATPKQAPALPLGAWDCHVHIYGPFDRHPVAVDAAYQPAERTFADLRRLHADLGISRGVLVQAAPYGRDHGAILEAIAQSGGDYRGVALLDPETGDDELLALHAGGVRGVRFNLMSHLRQSGSANDWAALAGRVSSFGWHVLVHGEGQRVLDLVESLAGVDVPVVIDHMARPDLTQDVDDVASDRLVEALSSSNVWIKLSGIDRASGGESGCWGRALNHVQRLLEAAPDRAIWGSDWPHPNVSGPIPDDAQLLRFALTVCGTEAAARAVFVDNPARLYD